ncbi:MAG: hypothetical protein LBC13_01865 [Clostridiales bacterium]|jgi:hypothetical protein|nr:hypothetical protein [Clostridiales bacterium]
MNTLSAVNGFEIQRIDVALGAVSCFAVYLVLALFIAVLSRTRVRGVRNAVILEFIFIVLLSNFRLQFGELMSLMGFAGNVMFVWTAYVTHIFFVAVIVFLNIVIIVFNDGLPFLGGMGDAVFYRGAPDTEAKRANVSYEVKDVSGRKSVLRLIQ